MSGTLGADRIQTSAGIIDLLNLRRAAPSAWVNFNGTGTLAVRDSVNVSSVTDNGVGDYTVNFATPMANANYAVTTAVSTDGLTQMFATINGTATALTTGNVRLASANNTPAVVDRAVYCVACFGGV